jgi:hypothetical protein
MCVAHQFISKVYRVIGKRDGKPFHLLTVFWVFEVPILPSSVLVRYERASVHLYVLNFVWCFWCQVWTHPTKVCLKPNLWQLQWVSSWCSCCTVWTALERVHVATEVVPCIGAREPFRNFGPRKAFPFWNPRGSYLKPNLRLGPSPVHHYFTTHKELMPFLLRPSTTRLQPILNNSIVPDWNIQSSCPGWWFPQPCHAWCNDALVPWTSAWYTNPTDSEKSTIIKQCLRPRSCWALQPDPSTAITMSDLLVLSWTH